MSAVLVFHSRITPVFPSAELVWTVPVIVLQETRIAEALHTQSGSAWLDA